MKTSPSLTTCCTLFVLLGGLSLAACDTASVTEETPDRGDLQVRYIQRLPEIGFVWGSTNPTVEGWPAVGQEVVWQAHVKSWSPNDREGIVYKWYLDDVEVSSGTVAIPAQAEVTLDYPWTWTFDRHELALVLDPEDAVAETQEQNNRLAFYTDALTVGFYVEQRFYDVLLNRWDDWLQGEISRWNAMLETALYPETPEGVLDRVRIDKITIIADGALPTATSSTCPNEQDRTVDMQWGYPASQAATYREIFNSGAVESTLHELGHARYLIDVYAFDVLHGVRGDSVAIQENGDSIVGTARLPSLGKISSTNSMGIQEEGEILHRTALTGLMNSTSSRNYDHMDRYSAAAMNLITGHRATVGNCNPPENIGVFINDLPADNRLTVKDQSSQLLVGANVLIYQAQPNPGGLYGKSYDDVPDLTFTTDDNGQVLLGRNPFNSNGSIVHDPREGSTMVALVRVEHGGKVGYAFLEAAWFNLAYWQGHAELGEYEIEFNLVGTTAAAKNAR